MTNPCPGFPETDIEEVECDSLYGRRLTGDTIGGECGSPGTMQPILQVPTDKPHHRHPFPLTELYCRRCAEYVTVEDMLERNPRLQRTVEIEMERLGLPKTNPVSWGRFWKEVRK